MPNKILSVAHFLERFKGILSSGQDPNSILSQATEMLDISNLDKDKIIKYLRDNDKDKKFLQFFEKIKKNPLKISELPSLLRDIDDLSDVNLSIVNLSAQDYVENTMKLVSFYVQDPKEDTLNFIYSNLTNIHTLISSDTVLDILNRFYPKYFSTLSYDFTCEDLSDLFLDVSYIENRETLKLKLDDLITDSEPNVALSKNENEETMKEDTEEEKKEFIENEEEVMDTPNEEPEVNDQTDELEIDLSKKKMINKNQKLLSEVLMLETELSKKKRINKNQKLLSEVSKLERLALSRVKRENLRLSTELVKLSRDSDYFRDKGSKEEQDKKYGPDFINKYKSSDVRYTLLPSDTIQHNGKTLYRIQALEDIYNLETRKIDIKKGTLGGYIESRKNLEEDRDSGAWVHDEGKVSGKARIIEGARIRDNAEVSGNAYVMGHRTEIGGNAKISGKAQIIDASITGDSLVTGGVFGALGSQRGLYQPRVMENAVIESGTILGQVILTDKCFIKGKQLRIEGSSNQKGNSHSITISGNAIIKTNGTISGEKIKIKDDVQISGNANISGKDIQISNKVKIYNEATLVGDRMKISDNAKIFGNVVIDVTKATTNKSFVIIKDDARMYGSAKITGGVNYFQISDKAEISGNFYFYGKSLSCYNNSKLYGDAKSGAKNLVVGEKAQILGNAHIMQGTVHLTDNVIIKDDAHINVLNEVYIKDKVQVIKQGKISSNQHDEIIALDGNQIIDSMYYPQAQDTKLSVGINSKNGSQVNTSMADIIFKGMVK